ncbi:MAG: hypothetical protein MHMPM18_000453 [Marteilia pararefringens]
MSDDDQKSDSKPKVDDNSESKLHGFSLEVSKIIEAKFDINLMNKIIDTIEEKVQNNEFLYEKNKCYQKKPEDATSFGLWLKSGQVPLKFINCLLKERGKEELLIYDETYNTMHMWNFIDNTNRFINEAKRTFKLKSSDCYEYGNYTNNQLYLLNTLKCLIDSTDNKQ